MRVPRFIGQETVIERFKVALSASFNSNSSLPSCLLVGPAGTGKTLLATLAAEKMGSTLHERIGQVLWGLEEVNNLLIAANDRDIVFIDEIHELPESCQVLLYRAMDSKTIFVHSLERQTYPVEIADFTIIGATTDEYRLLPPLRDRFKLILQFQYYDVQSLTEITLQRAEMMGVQIEPSVAAGIAAMSQDIPRRAVRLLESVHRFAQSRGDDKLTIQHFEATVRLEGLDRLGLSRDEQRYLRALAEHPGKAVRLGVLEAALGIHHRTIQSVIEPFLLRAGLIERCEKGRLLSTKGWSYLNETPAEIAAL